LVWFGLVWLAATVEINTTDGVDEVQRRIQVSLRRSKMYRDYALVFAGASINQMQQ
jgi:hypothetical protein